VLPRATWDGWKSHPALLFFGWRLRGPKASGRPHPDCEVRPTLATAIYPIEAHSGVIPPSRARGETKFRDPDPRERTMLPTSISRVCGMSTLSDRTHKPRLSEGMFLYLASVALVASAIIVLFSVSVTSLLDTNKETVTGARELLPGLGPAVIVEITSTADKSIGTASFYKGEIIVPVPAQTKSSSSSEASNMSPSTSVPPPFGMTRVEPEAEPAPQPAPDKEANVTAVEASHGRSHEVITQPLSIADEASAAQHDSGDTMPLLATFDPQLIQILQNFEIQRDDYANLAQDGATLATGSRFPEEPPMKESAMFSGATARPRSPALRHAASHRPSAVAADHKATRKLNRAELSRLLDPH